MKPTILVLLALSIVVGCSDLGDQLPGSFVSPIAANRIVQVDVTGRSLSFLVNCTMPEPCWVFQRIDQTLSGTVASIRVYGRRTTTEACAQVIWWLDARCNVSVPSAGTYTFTFWRGGTSTVDTTLSVP